MDTTEITYPALAAAGVNIDRVHRHQENDGTQGWVAYDADRPEDATARIVIGECPDEDGHYPTPPIAWAWTEYERDGDGWAETGWYDLDASFASRLAAVTDLTTT